VPSSIGPGKGFESSLTAYHGYVSYQQDVSAGLFGPLVVYGEGKMDKVMKSAREFPLVLYQATEASSFLAYDNALMKGIDTDASTNATMSSSSVANATWWQPQLGNMPNVTLSSSQAPTFFSINGYVYAPGPAFEMCSGDDIIFYVYAYGAGGFHVLHFHGMNLDYPTTGTKIAYAIAESEMTTGYGTGPLPGVWQVICHLSDHLSNGMLANYNVYPKDNCPLSSLG